MQTPAYNRAGKEEGREEEDVGIGPPLGAGASAAVPAPGAASPASAGPPAASRQLSCGLMPSTHGIVTNGIVTTGIVTTGIS